jgi:excisionase family DNA binding protein
MAEKGSPPKAEVITVEELAHWPVCSISSVYRMSLAGKPPAFKVGRDWRYRTSEIEQWIRESERKWRRRQ